MEFNYSTSSKLYSLEFAQSANVQGHMGSWEQRVFMQHIGATSTCAVEIGAWHGLSSVLVGKGMQGTGRYYCIDTYEASNVELKHERTLESWLASITKYGLQSTCIPIVGWSFEPDVLAQVPSNLDFVYIDGDHTPCSVILDALLYRDKLRPGGLLLFHDSTWQSVKTGQQWLIDRNYMRPKSFWDDFGVFLNLLEKTNPVETAEMLAKVKATLGRV